MELDEYRLMAAAERSHWWYASTRALLAATLAPFLAGRPRVLDAGCGTGAAGGWLGSHGPVVGVDVERLALQLYRESRPETALVAASLADLPLVSASFDLVLCVTVLYHRRVADPAAVTRELVRVLRPGGVLCLLEPGLPSLRRAHDRVTHTARRFSRRDLRDLLIGAGLTPLRTTGAYAFLVPPARVKGALERDEAPQSDLSSGGGAVGAICSLLASLERSWLARWDLPTGLSVLGVGVKQ
jgi:SAM-dependent methyltransferase